MTPYVVIGVIVGGFHWMTDVKDNEAAIMGLLISWGWCFLIQVAI